jgi:hypothetical protein
MLMKHLLLVLLAPAMLFSGCAVVHMREDTAVAPSYAPHAEYATQVAIGECVFTRQEESAFAAIGSALLANAISGGINRIGTALTEAAKEKSLSANASRNIEVTFDTFGPCVQIVRGWFYQDPFPLGTDDDPFAGNSKFVAAQSWFSPDFISRERFRTLWLRNQLWLAAPPEFVFEGRIMMASKNALTIAAQYVRLNEPLFMRTLRRDPSRHVAVFLSFHTPGTAVDAEANPGATFLLGRLMPGEARIYPDPRSIARFAPKAGVLNRWPHESDWFTLAVGKEKEPWIVSAAVTEKQNGNEFLAFVAEVFGGAKETITTQVQNLVIPEKRAAAREAATTAQEAAATVLDQKQVGALTALATCAQADAPTAQQASEARIALRGLNQAARGANREEPASQACIDKISITATPAATKTACSDLRTTLAAGQTCK